ncbi:MAG: aminotransferase class V-fold PLP-dependent enzyme [Planctomycetota bacterium]
MHHTAFEAGTPPIAEAVALGRAVEYLLDVGLDQIAAHCATLGAHALSRLREIDRVQVIGDQASARSGIVSFHVAGVHPHDLATMLDLDGIAVRAGEHCCQPLMDTLGVDGTVRLSSYLYNTIDEIDAAVDSVARATAALAP